MTKKNIEGPGSQRFVSAKEILKKNRQIILFILVVVIMILLAGWISDVLIRQLDTKM